jgi:hypothetical protein
MNKKGSFSTYLAYSWYWFLLIAVGIGFSYYGLYVTLNSPSESETLQVFLGVKNIDKVALSKRCDEVLSSSIKEVKLDYSDPSSTYYPTVFQTRGLTNTDVLVLSTDSIKEKDYSTYFLSLTTESLSSYFNVSSSSFASYEGINYGVKINSETLSTLYGVEGLSYYAFINKKSIKSGSLSTSSSNDGALLLLGVLCHE